MLKKIEPAVYEVPEYTGSVALWLQITSERNKDQNFAKAPGSNEAAHENVHSLRIKMNKTVGALTG